jgi:hypothetical protein
VPGKPLESLLFLKVSGTAPLPAGCGNKMPPWKGKGGNPKIPPETAQLLEAWIANGAP